MRNEAMIGTVFYSWQSDCPQNRNFIEQSLKQAIKELRKVDALRIDPCLDRALAGATGAPRIDQDILTRIDSCEVFVGDVTLVTAPDAVGRPSPNPNVLFELGYAVKTIGWERTILAFNSKFAAKELLPFDLDKNRLAIFECDFESNSEPKAETRSKLATVFRDAINAILSLPTIQHDVESFFDQTNPIILELFRKGHCRLSINVADHRIPLLLDLRSQRGFGDYIELIPNGNILGNATCSNGGINDLQAVGMLTGFDVVFKKRA